MPSSPFLKFSLLGSLLTIAFAIGLSTLNPSSSIYSDSCVEEHTVDVWSCEGMFDDVEAPMLMPTPCTFALPREEEEVFKLIEEMPRFPGCEDIADEHERKTCSDRKFLEFVHGNLKLPKSVHTNCGYYGGMAVIQFYIETDGRISNAKIIRDAGGWLGDVGLEVVNSMNEKGIRWTPGRQDGRAVRVQFNLPVRIRLE